MKHGSHDRQNMDNPCLGVARYICHVKSLEMLSGTISLDLLLFIKQV